MTAVTTSDISDQCDRLEANRSVLQGILESAASLETLREGLEISLQLGQSSKSLPMEALLLYRDLGGKIRSLSDSDVLLMLRGLDKKVTLRLDAIIPLINFIVTVGSNSSDDIAEQISQFHQLTKTAVTLRVLLYKRGTDTPPLKLKCQSLSYAISLPLLKSENSNIAKK